MAPMQFQSHIRGLLLVGLHGLLAIALLATRARPCPSEPGRPQDPAESAGVQAAHRACAEAFIDAYNSGVEARLREFEGTYRSRSERSLEERIQGIRGLWERWGSLSELGELEPSPEGPVGYVRAARRGEWLALTFLFEPDLDSELAGVRMEVTHGPRLRAALAAEWTSLEQLLPRLEPLGIAPAMAVAFVRGDRILDARASGCRSIENLDDRVDANTRFHIGSCGKPMTAMLVAILETAGRIDSQAHLGQLLPEVAAGTPYAEVTLDQLLQHRSGLSPENEFAGLRTLTGSPREQRAQALPGWLGTTPAAPPGERMHYANAGYSIVGAALERALDVPFEGLMKTHVFVPLGLTSAGFGPAVSPTHPHGVVDHVPTPSGPSPSAFSSVPPALAPAGDIHMDLGDFARLAQVHLTGLAGRDAYFPARVIHWLHTLPDSTDDAATYARGWGISRDSKGVAVHNHAGSNGASFAQITLLPEFDLGIVILMNHAPTPDVQACANALIEVARERHGATGDEGAGGR